MDAKLKAVVQQNMYFNQHKENIFAWKHDLGVLFDITMREVRKTAVEMQQLAKETGMGMIRKVKEEKLKLLQEADEASKKLEEKIKNNEAELKATKDWLMLEPDVLAAKIASGEVSVDYSPDVFKAELPFPQVDMSKYVEEMNYMKKILLEMQSKEIIKVTKTEEEITTIGLKDPMEIIAEGKTLDGHIMTTWNQADGTFGASLWNYEVEAALTQFSIQTRLNMLKQDVKSFQELNKVPEKGEMVITNNKGSFARGKITGLRVDDKKARVQLVDYGTQEGFPFAAIWPYFQDLGRNEPHQCFDCTLLEDLSNAKDPIYNEARWDFARLFQGEMKNSGGSNVTMITFRSKESIEERPVWLVDLHVFDEHNKVQDASAYLRAKIPEDKVKAQIGCRDVRYASHEIKTTFITSKEEKPPAEPAKDLANGPKSGDVPQAANEEQKPNEPAKGKPVEQVPTETSATPMEPASAAPGNTQPPAHFVKVETPQGGKQPGGEGVKKRGIQDILGGLTMGASLAPKKSDAPSQSESNSEEVD